MMMDILLVIIGLIALLIASISDMKTREVPDWISYGLIFTGFTLRILYSVMYNEWNYLWYGILGFGVMMILGNLMFRAKQWGGGDTKLIMGIGVIFATKPAFLPLNDIPFLAVMVVNILVIGAVYGIVYGIILATKNKKQFLPEAKKISKERKMVFMKICALLFAVASVIMTITTDLDEQVKLMIGGLAFLLLIYPYLTILIKGVEKVALMKHLPVSKLTPGDWVEQDVYKNGKILYKKKPLGIEQEDIAKLIKAKIGKVLVKEGIPFIPPFFLGALVTVIMGKIVFLIV